MSYYSPYFPFLVLPVVLAGLYFLLENRLTKPWMRWAWWIGCLLILLVAGWYASVQHQYWYDFIKGYYHSGRKIVANQDLLYDESCYGYVNFPLLAYLFVPFAKLPKELAGALFFLIGYLSILPLAYSLVKFSGAKGWSRWVILGFLAVSGPLDYSVWLGNITHVIMLGMILLLWWFKQGRQWLTGFLLGAVGLIKIPLILPAGYFFIRRQWRVVGGGLLAFGIVLGLSLWLVPFSLNTTWLDRCILSFSGNPVPAYNNQAVSGFLAREFMPGNLSWEPQTPPAGFTLASNLALFVLYAPVVVMLFLGLRSPRTPSMLLLEFFIVLVCSILTSPISWTHYFMLLLIPAAFCMADDDLMGNKTWKYVLLGAALLLISTPVKLTMALFEQTGQELFFSMYFIGGLLLYLFLIAVWIDFRRTANRRSV